MTNSGLHIAGRTNASGRFFSLLAVTIDVKNINLQIKKNTKNLFFHFYKNIKNMDKNIKLHYPFK